MSRSTATMWRPLERQAAIEAPSKYKSNGLKNLFCGEPRKKEKEGNEVGNTSVGMPIHNNVTFLCDGVKDDTEEVIILLTSPSPKLVAVHLSEHGSL